MATATPEFARQLGLTGYELRGYLALVRYGQLHGGEAAQKSGVPNAKIYGTLRSLAEKNLAVMVKEKPMVFKAVAPQKAIEALLDEKKAGLESASKSALNFFLQQRPEAEKKEFSGKIDINLGTEQRLRNSWHLHKTAKKYYYMVSPVDFTLPAYLVKARSESLGRGVDERFIVTRLTPENKKEVAKYCRTMPEMRFLEDPDYSNLSIYVWDDKKFIIVVIDPADRSKTLTITVDSSDLAKAMKKYFLDLYKKAGAIKPADLR